MTVVGALRRADRLTSRPGGDVDCFMALVVSRAVTAEIGSFKAPSNAYHGQDTDSRCYIRQRRLHNPRTAAAAGVVCLVDVANEPEGPEGASDSAAEVCDGQRFHRLS